MPYHARFGNPATPAWISRPTSWLGTHLGIRGEPGARHRIWPIVQLSDWGDPVSAEKVAAMGDPGTRRPTAGVMVFARSALRQQPKKVDKTAELYRAIRPKVVADRYAGTRAHSHSYSLAAFR
jgi:hypothetical protein